MNTGDEAFQLLDGGRNVIMNANRAIDVYGSDTFELIPATYLGVFLGLWIFQETETAECYFTDGNGDPVPGLPDETHPFLLDAQGQLTIPRLEMRKGLKIVTTNATGLVAEAYAFTFPKS